MAWNNLVGPLAITRRRRAVATAVVYGLSLTVRFVSAAGEDLPARVAQGTDPMTSIMLNDGAQLFSRSWPPRAARSVAFLDGRSPHPTSCRAACDGAVPIVSMSSCAAPP